jgi:hypothetical protein
MGVVVQRDWVRDALVWGRGQTAAGIGMLSPACDDSACVQARALRTGFRQEVRCGFSVLHRA